MRKRKIPRPFKMPWGKGLIIEEASYRAQHHEPTIQLMEYPDGQLSIRFCYYSKGVFHRAPLMLDTRDMKQLKAALRTTPRLKKILSSLL